MRGNDLLPGALYQGPLHEFDAYDALPRAVRRALDNALFQWSEASHGELTSGLTRLVEEIGELKIDANMKGHITMVRAGINGL